MSQLPTGWAFTSIAELGEMVGGKTPSKSEPRFWSEGSIPWVSPKDMKVFDLIDSEDKISEAAVSKGGMSLLPAKSILMVTRSGILAHSFPVAITQQPVTINQDIKAIPPSAAFVPRFLAYNLKSQQKTILGNCSKAGTTVASVETERLNNLPLPLAPLSEQKRIADKLDTMLARVDVCRDRLDRLPALLKRFRQSILAAAMSGKLSEDWREHHSQSDMAAAITALPSDQKARRGVSADTIPASEYASTWEYPNTWWSGTAAALLCKGVFVDIKDGNHGANHPVVSDFTTDGLPFITAAQVDRFKIDYDSAYKISGEPLEKLRVGFAKDGDVILTHKGTVGRLGLADRDCVLTPQTTYYRTNREYVVPEFSMYYMASQPFSGQLDDIKSQTTRDFVPITQQYALVHLLPPLLEQHEIVRRVETLFAFADSLEARLATARRQVGQLTPALLAKAFRGELVPQDPADEPASELLKRLAAQRETAAPAKRGRRHASA